MSNKVQIRPLLARNTQTSESSLFLNCGMSFNHYETELDANLIVIMNKYPHLNRQKVRDLLE